MFIQFTFLKKEIKNTVPPFSFAFRATNLLSNTIIFRLSGSFLYGNCTYKFPMWLLYMINVDLKHKYSIICHIYTLSYIWRNMLAIWQALELYSVLNFQQKLTDLILQNLLWMLKWYLGDLLIPLCVHVWVPNLSSEGLGHNCHPPLHRNLTMLMVRKGVNNY